MNLRRPLLAALTALLLSLAGCSTWERTEDYVGWSLYVKSGETVSASAFFAAVQPAFEAVERELGPFKRDVRVHAWNGGVQMSDGTKGLITSERADTIADIPGIGPARVRAFHARGDGGLFSLSGVFVGTADVGTSVHELVHARLAESGERLPLWFEEGFAMIVGDGAMYDGTWVVDGLACWPWRELRELDLRLADIEPLLELGSSTPHSVRENVLVHFVGWAIVFDLYREVGVLDWKALLARYRESPHTSSDSYERMQRSLQESATKTWLERLRDPDPAIRLAAARGTWKLRSKSTQRVLLRALREESDPEVRASLAVNTLATASQVDMGRREWGWMRRSLFPALRNTTLEDPDETSALRTIYRAYRYGNENYDTQAALERLGRFWAD